MCAISHIFACYTFTYMEQRRKPPEIHFYEDTSLSRSPFLSTRLTRVVRFCTFGLVRNDAQASIIVFLLLIAGMAATIWYVRTNQGVAPTTTYELLPQEVVGSQQGLPPAPSEYEN